jgi:acetyl esterase/lipase
MPAGAVLVSPWVDIAPNLPGFSLFKNMDVISPSHIDLYTHYYIPDLQSLQQNERDQYLKNPLISPFYGSYNGVCPLLVTFGDHEMLSESISAFIQRLSNDGCHVDTIKGDGAHIWMIFPPMAKSKQHFQNDCEKMISWMANRYKTIVMK